MLLVGLFDGISALRVVVDCLDLNVLGHISVESNEEASQASLVLIGSGAPCQGVSQLNAQRRGALRDSRNSLFLHVPRIKELVRKSFPGLEYTIASLSENVFSMDEVDRVAMRKTICNPGGRHDAEIMRVIALLEKPIAC